MLTVYEHHAGTLQKSQASIPPSEECVWYDMLDPTPEDVALVEKATGAEMPTRDEVREIEASNRYYEENGATYMTVFVIINSEKESLLPVTVTFILIGNRLVTVRYSEPKSFPMFAHRAEKGLVACQSGPAIMIGLIEILIQRKADLIERVQDAVDKLAHGIFNLDAKRRDSTRRLDVLLKKTGREGDIVSRALESASSLDRLLHFFAMTGQEKKLRTTNHAAHRHRAKGYHVAQRAYPVLDDTHRLPAGSHAWDDFNRAKPDHQIILGDGRHAHAADAGGFGLRHEF
jgi:magnesium transporter